MKSFTGSRTDDCCLASVRILWLSPQVKRGNLNRHNFGGLYEFCGSQREFLETPVKKVRPHNKQYRLGLPIL